MAKQLGASVRKPTQEEIAERAYAIYVQNGRMPGQDLDNWLEAEAQLKAAMAIPEKAVEPKPNIRVPAKAGLQPSFGKRM